MNNPWASKLLYAPWTPEQVQRLNRYQQSGRMHPYTCGGPRTDAAHRARQAEYPQEDLGQLAATPQGWLCPVCGYQQSWALRRMAEVDV